MVHVKGVKSIYDKNCPLCKNNNIQELYEFHESPYQSIIPASIVECQNCKLIYKIQHNNKPIAEYYDNSQFAEHAYFANEDVSNSELQKIINYIKSNCPDKKKLIDFGCGAGFFLKLAKIAGYTVSGIELNKTLASATQRELNVTIFNEDINEFSDADNNYEIVTMLDFVEHLEQPFEILRKAFRMLEPGGCLVLYTPNHRSLLVKISRIITKITKKISFVYPIFNDLHLVYFDKNSLKKLAEDTGFKVIKTKMIKYNPDRTGIARGIIAFNLKIVELISSLFNMQYRILMIAKKV